MPTFLDSNGAKRLVAEVKALVDRDYKTSAEVTEDVDQLKDEVADQKSAIAKKAGMLVDTASGAIASFVPDATIDHLLGLDVAVEPVQDLHGYDNPWPAGGGTNKFDKDHTINSTYTSSIATALSTYKSTGEYATGYTANATSITENAQYCTSFTPCASGTTYTISNLTSGSNLALVGFVDDTGTVVSHNSSWSNQAWTHAADSTEKYIMICAKVEELANVMIVEGSTMPSTPSPFSNLCPISGWSAVEIEASSINAWDEEWLNGYLGNNGAFIADALSASSICAKNFITVHPGQTMYVAVPNGTSARICAYAADGTYLERINAANSVYTVPNNAYKIKFSVYNYGTTYNNNISINYPATDHAYHPYTGNTYTITIGRTVYGGTLDVTGGKMYARPFFSSYDGQTLIGPWISSMDVYAEGTTPTIGAEVVDMGGTPTVYDIDPVQIATIAGQTNNVWADAGDVSVEYAADIKAYIDRLNQSPEDDMIANTLIASGKYFTVNNRLFLSTASIAAGAQIIPGTNCTETSLVAALNALNA